MPQYLIESPHTKEECLESLDEIKDKDLELLEKFEFGCKAGEHTGWATVDASSRDEVLNMLPEKMREKSKVVEVTRFTPKQIESYHSM